MKRKNVITIMLAAAVLSACVTWLVTSPQPVLAASPVSGAVNAKAGSGGVTAATFVKLSAAGTIVATSAVTDKVVGVCELTAAADAMTRYAPAGTQTTVTSGEQIAVGDLLTTGAGGKAFVLDADDASTQRVGAIALTAASGADESVTVIVAPGVVEQRLVMAGAVKTQTSLIVPGFLTGATTCDADVLAIPITHAFVTKTTGADAEALTLANGTAGQLLAITLGTDGNGDGTLTPATSTGWATIVFADAGDNATLMYVDDTVGWVILGLSGLSAQPAYTQ
ncbi:MAG TPA: hypothetical protein VMY35_00220 [Phycisphaerae bacterium]|nr:hypothetical protein [Phycisphaerae bacterium]